MALQAAYEYLQQAVGHGAWSSTQTLTLLLIAVPTVLLLLASLAKSTSSSGKGKPPLPPSPPGTLPIVGHLHHIGPQTHISLQELVAKYGHNGFLFLRAGAVPTLIVSSPSAAEAVMRTHDHIFASRPWSMASHILRYNTCDVAFSPLGEYWQQTRKLMNTHLLSNKKVYSFRHGREEEVCLVVDNLREAAAKSPSTAVDMSEVLAAYTNDVVSRSVLGSTHRKKGRNTLFREMTMTNVDLLVGFNLEYYIPRWPLTDLLFRLVCWKVTRHLKRWDSLLEEVIHEHVEMRKLSGDKEKESDDFIDIFLSRYEEYGFTMDNVKSLLMNVFEAAIETSYLVLESAMAELMNHRRVMKKLQAEVRAYGAEKKLDMIREDDLSSLPYLKASMKEALRLHPPGPLLLPHYSTADCQIDGYHIPANTRVLVNGWAIGRDPAVWEKPEEFMPERFMRDGWDKSNSYSGQDFRYLPFGSGRRICPGANFALATMEIMLANLMYHFDWEVPNEKEDGGGKVSMDETFGLMLRRNEPLYLVPRAV
uniref:Cytochrome P450 CYP71C3v3 n=1 Tax=Zea mays TaxID=4577 RepID=B6T5Y0_MAIZE|nr:cytochrome P450 CYP71C3v3 [Zea mays]